MARPSRYGMRSLGSEGLGTRLDSNKAKVVRAHAERLGMSVSRLLRQIVDDWLDDMVDGIEYPQREQARAAVAELRKQGFEATYAGVRGHWRVTTRAEFASAGTGGEAN